MAGAQGIQRVCAHFIKSLRHLVIAFFKLRPQVAGQPGNGPAHPQFIARTAFLVSLVGAVLFLGGTRTLKILAFPLFLLVFMFPIPAIIYARITLPLQLFASSVAETVLNFIGTPVLRDGNVLELANGQRLSVVEACSGIRSLLSLSFLSLIYAYFFDHKVWMRWFLLAATIPIAIAANASRVTLTGLISEYRPDLAQGLLVSVLPIDRCHTLRSLPRSWNRAATIRTWRSSSGSS